MKYDKQLPPVRDLLQLAKSVRFPITREMFTQAALQQSADQTMLDFLTLYPTDEVFKSKVDFMTRSEELELLITQQYRMGETARSPRG